jgi:hypothetical protein
MSSPSLSSSEHLHPDEQSLKNYSSISRLAILAFGLGIASALVLVSPALAIIPVLTAGVAFIALRQIAASDGELTGRWPATVGLCLAMGFLGWGITRQSTRQAVLLAEAERAVDAWLELVRDNKLVEAHQRMKSVDSRVKGEQALKDYYASDRDAREHMDVTFSTDPMKSFRAIGRDVEFHNAGVVVSTNNGFLDDVMLRYDYVDPRTNDTNSMWITATRSWNPTTQRASWYVNHVDANLPAKFR